MSVPPPSPDGARVTLAWLAHPVTVGALVLLVVNDHLLKAAFPGSVTGKLSDVAGLVLAPPLVAVLLTLVAPRLRASTAVVVGFGLTAAGFTAVKSSGYAAAGASALWTAVSGPSLVRADRTDLIALPALALAGWCWSRARRDPVRHRSARLVRLLVLLPAATVAVAATSPVPYPDGAGAAVLDGRLVAGIGHSGDSYASDAYGWRVSDDAGATWRDPTAAETEALVGALGPVAGPVSRSCSVAVPGRCYRLVAGKIRVEQSDDAGQNWRLAWEVTEEQRAVLVRQYPGAGDGARVATQELAVLDVGNGRHVVLVANGRDGFAVRDPDGSWRRIGFAGKEVAEHPFGGRPPELGRSTPADRGADPLLALLLGFTLAVATLVVAGARAALRAGVGRWLAVVLAGLVAVAMSLLAAVWARQLGLSELGLVTLVPVLVGAVTLALVPAWWRGASGRWTFEAFLAAALTLALAALPLVGWLYGRPAYVEVAVPAAFLAAVPGLALGWRAVRLVEPRAEPRGPAEPPWPPLPVAVPPRPGVPPR
ncbi:hypothetical protein NCC78_15425 [Micromonospora phytophila]|uniref:hypothetical protein n=1 Tax=Micromonospora phytophila TaxID=709888 RepID=UPI00202E5B84|nr:hypothetical protein [Micromonospora phytophila]MCM0676071.1 hypothetical protein [Micromonospora phytophila]